LYLVVGSGTERKYIITRAGIVVKKLRRLGVGR